MFKGSKIQKWLANAAYQVISIIAMASVAIACCFTLLFRTVVVDGSSMNPTLWDMDRLIVSAGVTGYDYGDIVVICQPNTMEKVLIKRVIATEGQTIDINFRTGDVYIDGELLSEPYIADPTTLEEGMKFPVTVPEGCVFCMGDNRLHSTDSRSTMVGFINKNYIMGRVLFRVAPKFDLHVAEF